jgi:hypothetical protein
MFIVITFRLVWTSFMRGILRSNSKYSWCVAFLGSQPLGYLYTIQLYYIQFCNSGVSLYDYHLHCLVVLFLVKCRHIIPANSRHLILLVFNCQSCSWWNCLYTYLVSHGFRSVWYLEWSLKRWQHMVLYLLAGGLSNTKCPCGYWMWRRVCTTLRYSVPRHVGPFNLHRLET